MYTQTLILNQTYNPHEVVDWKDAVTAMFKGAVEVLIQYDAVLVHIDRHSLLTFPELARALRQVIGTDAEELTIKVPAVAVLRRRLSATKSGAKFSKLNVCLRDDFRRQYCSARLPMSELNYDHVIPRARGGKTEWENIVMTCFACNQHKGMKTVTEAGMRLLKVPTRPAVLPMRGPVIDYRRAPPKWEPFIAQVA
ncbi:MAG: HNH endonuclease [Polyangiaceae bacterium]|nr:HNH endonuclease [Polyangiaceae bacterium]